jgi:hypothetical protein
LADHLWESEERGGERILTLDMAFAVGGVRVGVDATAGVSAATGVVAAIGALVVDGRGPNGDAGKVIGLSGEAGFISAGLGPNIGFAKSSFCAGFSVAFCAPNENPPEVEGSALNNDVGSSFFSTDARGPKRGARSFFSIGIPNDGTCGSSFFTVLLVAPNPPKIDTGFADSSFFSSNPNIGLLGSAGFPNNDAPDGFSFGCWSNVKPPVV